MYEGPLRTNVKSVKTSILVLKVIQGHCFRCQWKPAYDFLLGINCNLGPYLAPFPKYGHLLVIGSKLQNFPTSLSLRALDWGDLYGIFGKALQILKLESSRQPTVKISLS